MTDDFGKGRDLLELVSVQQQIERAVAYATNDIAEQLRGLIQYLIGYPHDKRGVPESPIEAIFLAWFCALERMSADNTYSEYELLAQENVRAQGNDYRFDFVVRFGDQDLREKADRLGVKQPQVAIELDGHDFHERTKEQVERRNKRDRDLQMSDWKVFHFSGSELFRSPSQHVEEVRAYCSSRYVDFLSEILSAEK